MKRLALAALLVLALAVPVTARAVTSSITLNELDPHAGGPATFTIVMPSKYGCAAGNCKSHVELDCVQSGVVVQSEVIGSDTAQTTGFTLGTNWAAGPADCTAILTYVDHRAWIELARTSFTATG